MPVLVELFVGISVLSSHFSYCNSPLDAATSVFGSISLQNDWNDMYLTNWLSLKREMMELSANEKKSYQIYNQNGNIGSERLHGQCGKSAKLH